MVRSRLRLYPALLNHHPSVPMNVNLPKSITKKDAVIIMNAHVCAVSRTKNTT